MKKILIAICLLALSVSVFSAIGAGAFSVEAKRGFSWYFAQSDIIVDWTIYEAKWVAMMEAQGIEWNKQRLEQKEGRKEKIVQIREALRGATDEQINAALAALGLN